MFAVGAAFDLRNLVEWPMGPVNETTYEAHNPQPSVGHRTGVDLPTNVYPSDGSGVVDTEWSGVAYFSKQETSGSLTYDDEYLLVTPDEEPRIEVFRLHANTRDSNDNLVSVATITLADFGSGAEGIAWHGGNRFSLVEEGTGKIYVVDIPDSMIESGGTISKNAAGNPNNVSEITMNPNPEDHVNQESNDNDGIEGVAFDPLNNVHYVVKEVGENQGVWKIASNGVATPLSIPEFGDDWTNADAEPLPDDRYDNDALFSDFSDIFFGRLPGAPASDKGFLIISSELGREDLIKVDLNTNRVVELVTKDEPQANRPFDIEDFQIAFPNVTVTLLADNEHQLMRQLEGISFKPNGRDMFLVADDDLRPDPDEGNGNDVTDYRWFVDVTLIEKADYDVDHNHVDLDDIEIIHDTILNGQVETSQNYWRFVAAGNATSSVNIAPTNSEWSSPAIGNVATIGYRLNGTTKVVRSEVWQYDSRQGQTKWWLDDSQNFVANIANFTAAQVTVPVYNVGRTNSSTKLAQPTLSELNQNGFSGNSLALLPYGTLVQISLSGNQEELYKWVQTGFERVTRHYDLNFDGVVDPRDGLYLVEHVMQLGIGDSNVTPLYINGTSSGSSDPQFIYLFNSSDLAAAMQSGEYEDLISNNSTWSEGDWNFDGEFDSSDLVIAFLLGVYRPI